MRQNVLNRVSCVKQIALVTMVALGASGLAMLADTTAQARFHSRPMNAAPAAKTAEKDKATDVKSVSKETPTPVATGPIQTIVSTDLLKDPGKFLNKRVSFDGTFNSFSSLGLDYKPAFRDGKDHVSFLILRPDVAGHNIPMSELKLIVPRKKVESIIHLDQGDKVQVKGQVFSAALGEPWLDVSDVTILQKAKGKEKDANKKAALDTKIDSKMPAPTGKEVINKLPETKPANLKSEPATSKPAILKDSKTEIKPEKIKPVELPPDKKTDKPLPATDSKGESKSDLNAAPKSEKP